VEIFFLLPKKEKVSGQGYWGGKKKLGLAKPKKGRGRLRHLEKNPPTCGGFCILLFDFPKWAPEKKVKKELKKDGGKKTLFSNGTLPKFFYGGKEGKAMWEDQPLGGLSKM